MPGIASRTSPGKSSHCQPSTTNNSAAVTSSIAHPIGGAKLAKAPITSDTPRDDEGERKSQHREFEGR
jgi:hypothetical protein